MPDHGHSKRIGDESNHRLTFVVNSGILLSIAVLNHKLPKFLASYNEPCQKGHIDGRSSPDWLSKESFFALSVKLTVNSITILIKINL